MEGTHEPVVSQELFDRANEKAFTHVPKKKVDKKSPKPLLFCPYCDRHMNFGGSPHKNYRCSQQHHGAIKECRQSRINRELLHNLLLNCTKEMADLVSADLKCRKKQWSESSMLSEEIESLQKEKTRLSARKFTIYDDYRSGNSSREKYLHNLDKIQERLAEIELMIPDLEQRIREANEKLMKADERENTLSDIAALQTYDRDVLSKVIEKVYVYAPDKVEIIWKADDIFYQEELLKPSEVINPAETVCVNNNLQKE